MGLISPGASSRHGSGSAETYCHGPANHGSCSTSTPSTTAVACYSRRDLYAELIQPHETWSQPRISNHCNSITKANLDVRQGVLLTNNSPSGHEGIGRAKPGTVHYNCRLFRVLSGSRGELKAAAVEVDGGGEVPPITKPEGGVFHPMNPCIPGFAVPYPCPLPHGVE